MNSQFIGIAAALGTAASWAAGSILFKRLSDRVSPLGLTLSKGIVSLLLLGVALLVFGTQPMSNNTIALLLVSGLLGIAVGDTLFFAALRDLGPVTLIVFFMLGQIFTALMAVVFLNEVPTPQIWAGIIITLVDVAVVLWPKIKSDSDQSSTNFRGILFGTGSMICMSVSIIIAKKGLEEVSALTATFLRMLSGTVGMFIFGLATRSLNDWVTPFRSVKLAGLLVASVLVVTFGGFYLSLVAIKHIDVATANTLGATEPLFVLPFAVLFLRERLTKFEILGTLLTGGGVLMLVNR